MEYYDAYHAIYRAHRIHITLLQSPANNQYRATLRTIHLQDTLNIIVKNIYIFCRNHSIIQFVFISFAELLIIKINTHEQSRTH